MEYVMSVVQRSVVIGIVLTIGLGACAVNTQPIYEVRNRQFVEQPDSLAVVSARIEQAARFLEWTTEVPSPGVLIASKRKGRKHAASVLVQFDSRKFSIINRDSLALDYDGERIHKLYNRWVRELEAAIARELSLLQ